MEKIMILDRIEDVFDKNGEIAGKQCFDKTGESVKVKAGQGGKLKERWSDLQVGRAFSFTMGEFKPPGKDMTFPYVQDFKSVESQFVEQAQKKVEDKTIQGKNRAFALSYAKDIACAKIQAGKEVTLKDLLNMTNAFDVYLEKGITEEALKLYAEIQKQFTKKEE